MAIEMFPFSFESTIWLICNGIPMWITLAIIWSIGNWVLTRTSDSAKENAKYAESLKGKLGNAYKLGMENNGLDITQKDFNYLENRLKSHSSDFHREIIDGWKTSINQKNTHKKSFSDDNFIDSEKQEASYDLLSDAFAKGKISVDSFVKIRKKLERSQSNKELAEILSKNGII